MFSNKNILLEYSSKSSESFKENYLKKGNIEIIAKISEEMKEMFKPKDSKLYFILFLLMLFLLKMKINKVKKMKKLIFLKSVVF